VLHIQYLDTCQIFYLKYKIITVKTIEAKLCFFKSGVFAKTASHVGISLCFNQIYLALTNGTTLYK